MNLASDWIRDSALGPERRGTKRLRTSYAQSRYNRPPDGTGIATSRSQTASTGLPRSFGRADTLIGATLRILTDDADTQATLKTSLAKLTRVLDAVHWPEVSKGDADAWLYFNEEFLSD